MKEEVGCASARQSKRASNGQREPGRPYGAEEDETIKSMWESDVAAWVIAQQTGRSQSAIHSRVAKKGWKRSAEYDPYAGHRWSPGKRGHDWLVEHWNDGTPMFELEAYFGVCDMAIYRYANEQGLGQRDKKAMVENRRERNGYTDRATLILRAVNRSGMTDGDIAEALGVKVGQVTHTKYHARRRGEIVRYRKAPKAVFEAGDVRLLKDAYRLGLRIETMVELLRVDGRRFTYHQISAWARRTGTRHRNSNRRFSILRLLSPDKMWAYSECTWNDPADLLQRAYRVSRVLTLKKALRCMRDYHEAMERFPQIPRICADHYDPFWLRNFSFWRGPHPEIEALREDVHDRKRRQ